MIAETWERVYHIHFMIISIIQFNWSPSWLNRMKDPHKSDKESDLFNTTEKDPSVGNFKTIDVISTHIKKNNNT